MMPNRIDERYPIFLLAVLLEGGLALFAWGLGEVLGCPPLADFHWNGKDFIVGTVASLPMLVLLVFSRWPGRTLAELRHFLETFVPSVFGQCSLTQLAVIALLAGVGEEMMFRGVLQNAIGQWLGPTIGLVGASVLFGLVHFISATYALIATLMGAYLGWLWDASDNLMVPIVTHAVYDFVALIYFLRLRGDSHNDE